MHTGQFGELGQIQSDGSVEMGDSATWTGHWVYLTSAENWEFTKIFEVGFGAYVRHPHQKMTDNGFGAYYENPWKGCISRDQLTGIIAALIATKDKWGMFRLMVHHSFRLFLFSYNTVHNGKNFNPNKWKLPDLTLMDIWACELRGFGLFSWLFWPLLCVLDLHMFFATLINLFRKQSDPINFAMKLIICKEHVPTIVSYLTFLACDKQKLGNEIDGYWYGMAGSTRNAPMVQRKVKVMRTKCPRCRYPHTVDAADMVATILDDPAHIKASIVVLPTKGVNKLHVIKPNVAAEVLDVYEKFKSGRLIEAPKKKADVPPTAEA